jgi:8-oxo-dGTP diphosphatase
MSYVSWIRSKLGTHKILLTFASVVLRDEGDRILLQYRTDFEVWGLPGGSLELGEDILTCARRELQEESGLTVGELSLVGVYTEPYFDAVYPNGDQVQQYTICLQGKVNGGKMQADGVESSDQAFFTPEDIPYDQILPWYEAMIRDALQVGEPVFAPPYTTPYPILQVEDVRAFIGNDLYIGMGAIGVTIDHDGRIMMVKRVDSGEWSLPGGYMNLGENVAYTAVREIREETNLSVKPESILGIYTPTSVWVYPNGDQVQAVITIFRCSLVGGTPRPDEHEICQIAWMTPDEVLKIDTHPILARLNRMVLEHLHQRVFFLS